MQDIRYTIAYDTILEHPMRTSSTTARTDPKLKQAFARLAKKLELSISDFINMLMRAAVDGKIHVAFLQESHDVCPLCGPDPAAKYPLGYLEELEKEADETLRLYKEGKIKGYTSAKEMMRDILKECE